MRCKCVPWVPSVPWSVNTTPFADEAPRIRADLRERIATACLVGLIACPSVQGNSPELCAAAVSFADELISRLDAEVKP
jgi:hypothetical protein